MIKYYYIIYLFSKFILFHYLFSIFFFFILEPIFLQINKKKSICFKFKRYYFTHIAIFFSF
ncbi:hypothetical protein DDB_G0292716 [Dictyostelium discoideum AX4]|uniref:hypothetical protein n=1 Tax=Dictyostelium discoideum AX4 TaxID=352472 RepID=UPI00004E34CC|nr:hypothetical protein DDB_G0292716 [Dictyostelium discoideum AX4]EAL61161.1 hypothetical protein DDB_G0292716 [Dictyostelium discoideum AX4]|eukprot:XP_629497.1 hypothetical protein DDB_G0292716 [Dictyostelium discoideum AX4]